MTPSVPAAEWGETEAGRCIVQDTYGGMTIIRADQRITITDEFLAADLSPDVTVADGVVTIRGDNRTVVYRLLDHHPGPRGWWRAEWLD